MTDTSNIEKQRRPLLSFTLTPEQKEAVVAAAKADGVKPAAFVRKATLAAAGVEA